jgi:hypothetical protein
MKICRLCNRSWSVGLENKKSTTISSPKKINEKKQKLTVDNLVSTTKTSMPSEKILRERMKYSAVAGF